MFLQRNYASTIYAFLLYTDVLPCVKGVNNSPILVRALLLHLNRLLQFTVGGAEVVVPFHVGSLVLGWLCCVCAGPPGAPPFEAHGFPTVSFQLWSRPTGEGRQGKASNRRGTVGFDRQRSWLNHNLVRFGERETRELSADVSLC